MASLIVGLLLAEIALRLFRPIGYLEPPRAIPGDTWRELLHQRSSIPGLAYELAANRSGFEKDALLETNSHAMRDTEPLADDTESLFRIVVLGDSFTFGWGVSGEYTYPNVLERLLNESTDVPPYRYDVLNLGVSAYSTQDEAIVLEHVGLRWKPRVVIVGYVLNDPETTPIQPLQNYL